MNCNIFISWNTKKNKVRLRTQSGKGLIMCYGRKKSKLRPNVCSIALFRYRNIYLHHWINLEKWGKMHAELSWLPLANAYLQIMTQSWLKEKFHSHVKILYDLSKYFNSRILIFNHLKWKKKKKKFLKSLLPLQIFKTYAGILVLILFQVPNYSGNSLE